MRLHQLTIEAFGPFGGRVEVDFDELNAAGQFLICGATGAGKTSILDAVCFALYGEVPGERQRAKHLRSDHAAPGVEPRVTLTLTIAERLIRISRSPAWERPKRRGSGMTTQQASVRLEQSQDGAWECLATRLDEAGHLVNTWLGMTPIQFTQVVLLPQGGFQTFLQSPTSARQAVLQRLFRTDRFERVERWFADFRRTLNRRRDEALHALDVISHRLAEVSETGMPPALESGVDAVKDWAERLNAVVVGTLAAATSESALAAAAHAAADLQLEEASRLAATLDRAESAERALSELDATAAAFAAEQERLRAHERASSLAPLLEASDQAQRAAEVAERKANLALTAVGMDAGVGDQTSDLESALEHARDDVRRAEQALALTSRIEAVRAQLTQTEARHREAAASTARLRACAAAVPPRQEQVSRDLARAVQARLDHAAAREQAERVQPCLDSAITLERLGADLESRLQVRREMQDDVQNLRQRYQDAREARIEAMASELAVGLVVGCSCPVCGSTSHPAPANATAGAGRKAEDRARRRYESAVVELAAMDDVLVGLCTQIEVLGRQTQGATSEQLSEQLRVLEERSAALAPLAEQVESLQRQSADLERELADFVAELEKLVILESQTRGQVETLTAQVTDLEQDLADTLGDSESATDHAIRARTAVERLQRARAAVRERDDAAAAAAQQQASLDLQARSLGFASGERAQAAMLTADVAAEIAAREAVRSQTGAAASATLNDPTVIASRGAPRPDLAAVTALAADAEQRLSVAQTQREIAHQRAERSAAITRELHAAIDALRPLDAQAQQVTALSGLLEGTGADNRLRMRLSAFVLAERLRQVVEAANARLAVISEGRYLLSYQEERGAGDNRGGLSLSIVDEWTGIRRDPTTLSGGETFVVSLCLALGLADTVADESGGLRIDTLFIDEGFGSLDAHTLDSVVDILSQLSQSGRVTGVVSHVMELRERLPAVLEVVSSKSGSTVRRASA
ncbi:MAG: SMC family ATPase [Marmoricola sp.]